jgi:hypothetical protein
MRINDKIKEKMKKISKLVGTIAIPCSISLGLIYSNCCSNNLELKEEDFKKADWYVVYNSNPSLINFFENEDVFPYAENFRLYQNIVRRENKGQVIGWIKVPDLDGDGTVDINRAYSKQKARKYL